MEVVALPASVNPFSAAWEKISIVVTSWIKSFASFTDASSFISLPPSFSRKVGTKPNRLPAIIGGGTLPVLIF
jgi:hypothetical protein